MATLIPSITTCKFDSSGEGRFARLLEAKLGKSGTLSNFTKNKKMQKGSRLHLLLQKPKQVLKYEKLIFQDPITEATCLKP